MVTWYILKFFLLTIIWRQQRSCVDTDTYSELLVSKQHICCWSTNHVKMCSTSALHQTPIPQQRAQRWRVLHLSTVAQQTEPCMSLERHVMRRSTLFDWSHREWCHTDVNYYVVAVNCFITALSSAHAQLGLGGSHAVTLHSRYSFRVRPGSVFRSRRLRSQDAGNCGGFSTPPCWRKLGKVCSPHTPSPFPVCKRSCLVNVWVLGLLCSSYDSHSWD